MITFVQGLARDYAALIFDDVDGKIWDGTAFQAVAGETLVTPAPNDPVTGSSHWTLIAEEKQLTPLSSLYLFDPPGSSILKSKNGGVDIHVFDVFDSSDGPTYGAHVAEAVDGTNSEAEPVSVDEISRYTVDQTGLSVGNTIHKATVFGGSPTAVVVSAKIVGGAAIGGVTSTVIGNTVIANVPVGGVTEGNVVEVTVTATDDDRAYTDVSYVRITPPMQDIVGGMQLDGETVQGQPFHADSFALKYHAHQSNYLDSGASPMTADELLQAVYTVVVVTGVPTATSTPRVNLPIPPAHVAKMSRRVDGTISAKPDIIIGLTATHRLAYDMETLYPDSFVKTVGAPSILPAGEIVIVSSGPRDHQAVLTITGGQVAVGVYTVSTTVTMENGDSELCIMTVRVKAT